MGTNRMRVQVSLDCKTRRTESVVLQADTFMDERVLGALFYAIRNSDVRLNLVQNGNLISGFGFGDIVFDNLPGQDNNDR